MLKSQLSRLYSYAVCLFQSCKAIIEAERDERLEKLKELHNDRELAVMEVMSGIETARPHIEMAIAFTNALIELGDPAELLSSQKLVRDRLKALLAAPLNPDIDVTVDFVSNIDDFKNAVKVCLV